MVRILREFDKKKIVSMRSIKELKRLFLSIFENHQLINDYFSTKLLFNYSNFFARFLSGLLLAELYWKPSREYSIRNESSYNLDYIYKFVMVMFMSFICSTPIVIITMTCKELSKNVTNVIMTCYLLQSKVHYNSYEYKEIRALWTFIFENQLSFSAAGFFDVHPSILLNIFAASVTYFLVLLQFN
ncbi:hypothetical protein ABEB36_004237 [Hypothenemus hampei]|uniref:Uncharacterized protein n=1 Tax=Hypothenemus hampei TaxID=57062 RepID=A0ABD1F2P7_HYPHA